MDMLENDLDLEYEVFDFIDGRTLSHPNITTETLRTIYVDRDRFDREVAVGQEKTFMAYSQFQKDVTRCCFHMNGRIMHRLPSNLPVSLIRYCTQAVLGLPVEILHHSGLLVAELIPKQPMMVFASDKEVTVAKSLRYTELNSMVMWNSVEMVVWVSVLDPVVSISFRFCDTEGNLHRETPLFGGVIAG